MRRREFFGLAGSVLAWPVATRAQSAKLPSVGLLGAGTLSAWSGWTAAFNQRLRELGWIEGRTITIEYRWAEGRSERFTEIGAEFMRLNVDVIVTVGTAVPALKQLTSAIPIVFAAALDPVGSGLVASLARPGGNVTGLSMQSTELVSKRCALLREILPGLPQAAPYSALTFTRYRTQPLSFIYAAFMYSQVLAELKDESEHNQSIIYS